MAVVIIRGTLFIDIDGTVFHDETEEPLPYAVEKINKAYDDGYVIILTTFRGENWDVTNRFSKVNSLRLFKSVGLKYHHIIWDSPSPRIIINDDKCGAYRHPKNSSWENVEL